jgi:ArsR family transcriptional regulator, arsenate/arsenite/antimonite-responsive transcriptional repressor
MSPTRTKETAPDAIEAGACCAPVMQAPLAEADAEELAAAFKVLADPVRLRLLSLISARDGETCACELVDVLDRSQPTISHHLSVLHDAGLLSREKRGRWVWYRTIPTRIEALSDSLAAR